MPKISAGLLLFRRGGDEIEVFLVHPGGPFWRKKNDGAWTIPKGEVEGDEDLLTAACRELEEETGITADGPWLELGSIRQKGGKIVHAWAVEGDADPSSIRSNTFELVWPPGSGRVQEFPEIDRAEFFALTKAREMILPSQMPLLDVLRERIGEG